MAVTDQKKRGVVDSKELLMLSLSKFYSNKATFQKVVPIIDGKHPISLRLIDWFVTNYAKKRSTIITKQIDNNVVHFNVYLSYRAQLKAYSKQQFDPFRRRERISYFYEKSRCIDTTIGQLNFFRWIIQNEILVYIEENIKEIEEDMLYTQKENVAKKHISDNIRVKVIKTESGDEITQKRKKRNELSKSFMKNMNKFDGVRRINFD